jgi:hypothetical protein
MKNLIQINDGKIWFVYVLKGDITMICRRQLLHITIGDLIDYTSLTEANVVQLRY